jgi:peroxiredoxin
MPHALGTSADMTETRLQPGQQLAPFELKTLSHGSVKVPGAGVLHLQFRRFAGCPICNLHVRAFAKHVAALEAAKVTTVAFFHSSAEVMRPLQGDLPFPVVADLERRWYQRFAVERSVMGPMHPRAMWAAMKGLATTNASPLKGEGGTDGLPADFLVSSDGRVLAAHYGGHADDSWSVEDVLAELDQSRLMK